MAKKSDLFARLSLDYMDHPKIVALSDAAVVAHITLILHARKYRTDGIIRKRVANRVGSQWDTDVLSELLHNDPEEPSLSELGNGDYLIHGYAEMQETRAEIEARRRRNAENGRLGGRPSKQTETHSVTESVSKSGTDSGTQKKAETEVETETDRERARKRASALPDSWTPSEDHQDRARKSGIDLDREVVKFRAYVEEKALTSKSWNQRFTRWLMNAEDYAKRDGRPSGNQPASLWDRVPNVTQQRLARERGEGA